MTIKKTMTVISKKVSTLYGYTTGAKQTAHWLRNGKVKRAEQQEPSA